MAIDTNYFGKTLPRMALAAKAARGGVTSATPGKAVPPAKPGTKTCPTCGGSGQTPRTVAGRKLVGKCVTCKGTGKVPTTTGGE